MVSHQDVSHTFNVRQSFLTKVDSLPPSFIPSGVPQNPGIPVHEINLLRELLKESEAKNVQKPPNPPCQYHYDRSTSTSDLRNQIPIYNSSRTNLGSNNYVTEMKIDFEPRKVTFAPINLHENQSRINF